MKIRFLSIILLMFVHTGCVKIMANEEGKALPVNFHDQRFGNSARDLLTNERFGSLKVEIQHMNGFKPDLAAIVALEKFLMQHLHKPEGIVIVTTEIEGDTTGSLSREAVAAIEKANRQYYSYGRQLTLYILYTNGTYTNPKILGEAYRNTSAVIYGKSILDHTGKVGQPDRTKLEATILLHEMGHLMGLVNKGSAEQSEHTDALHMSHCTNKNCLMYWANGLQDKFGYLVKGTIPQLDYACLEDLRANGGK